VARFRSVDSTHTGKIRARLTNNTIFELVNADTSGITSIANSHTMQVRNSTSLGNIRHHEQRLRY
jgi:hypothetical protein